MARVVHAHHALGIGEFEHHVGHQVALRQQARAGGVVDVGADLAGNPARQRLNAVGFVAQGAQLLLEQHGFQARQVIFQAFLTVGVEEELGVGQAWTHHLLVTGDDLLRVFRLDVGHEDKVRQQFARGVIHREILLVALHGVHQRFRRHRQEFLFEFGGQYHRPFHQRGHFFQQAVAQIGLAANLLRRQLCIALDEGFTRFIVGDHFAALQQDLRVLVGVVEGELGFAHEAVAAHGARRVDAQHGAWDQIGAQQHRDGMYRTHELHVGVAPTHQFRDRQFSQRGADHAGQQLLRRLAFDVGAVHQPLALVGHQAFRLIDGDAAAARPAFGRFARFAFGVERLGDRRAAFFNFAIGLRRAQVGHFQRQAARCGEPAHVTVFQAGVVQLGGEVGGERFRQGTKRLRRQLFRADFHQESLLSHGCLLVLVLLVAHREAQRFAGSVVGFGNGFGQRADAQNVALTLGHRNRLARVQQVEGMARLQDAFIGRQRQRFSSASSDWASFSYCSKQENRKSTSAYSKL